MVIASSESSELETLLNETIGEISVVWQNSIDNTFNMYTNVGGLYVEIKHEYTLVSSEPIQPQSSRVMRRKIIEL